MFLKCLPTGIFASNCYILGDSGEGAIIDCGVKADEVKEVIEKAGLKIKYIILTHGHIDHIAEVDRIREITGAKVVMHKDDAQSLSNSMLNGSTLLGSSAEFKSADGILNHGDVLEVGGLKLEVIHTPGHTPGGICIKVEDKVFTGDTLFRTSIGRTDLGNGNYEDIINSIRTRLMTLDESVTVYPGHGGDTTIGFEKRHNPFLQR